MSLLLKESHALEVNATEKPVRPPRKWIAAFIQILPTYLAVHMALALLTLFTPLFLLNDFSVNALSLHTLAQSWNRWDTGQYAAIAQNGYDGAWRTAFFPLFPLLERAGSFALHSPFLAGIVISNCSNLLMLVAFYQLVKEDFGHHQACRAILYISIFPSAFFFAASYTESLFLCLALISFYQIRHGHWWLAGIFGFMACLTRSAGIFLLFPFVYEYLRIQGLKRIRFDILAIALVPLGLTTYSAYCLLRFGDALAWEHAQAVWFHQFMMPWQTLWITLKAIKHGPGLLSFQTLHNLLDLLSIVFALIMTGLLVLGLWRLHREHLAYAVWSVPLALFLLSVPIIGTSLLPLQSFPRFMLEIFPVFIVAGGLGKHRWFHESYVLVSGSLFFLSCLVFLTGHWMV